MLRFGDFVRRRIEILVNSSESRDRILKKREGLASSIALHLFRTKNGFNRVTVFTSLPSESSSGPLQFSEETAIQHRKSSPCKQERLFLLLGFAHVDLWNKSNFTRRHDNCLVL